MQHLSRNASQLFTQQVGYGEYYRTRVKAARRGHWSSLRSRRVCNSC
jgi:hypothetical protein